MSDSALCLNKWAFRLPRITAIKKHINSIVESYLINNTGRYKWVQGSSTGSVQWSDVHTEICNFVIIEGAASVSFRFSFRFISRFTSTHILTPPCYSANFTNNHCSLTKLVHCLRKASLNKEWKTSKCPKFQHWNSMYWQACWQNVRYTPQDITKIETIGWDLFLCYRDYIWDVLKSQVRSLNLFKPFWVTE